MGLTRTNFSFLFLILATVSALGQTRPPAEILYTAGTVNFRKPPASFAPASNGVPLFVDYEVETKKQSRAHLRLYENNNVQLGEDSLMTVLPPESSANRGTLDLKRGAFFLFLRGRARELLLKTPFGVGASKGTEFAVKVDATAVEVTVLEGEVELRNELGVTNVTPGFQGFLEPGRAPRTARLLAQNTVVQWWLYYPGILNLDDVSLPAELGPSMAAYRGGDPGGALQSYPAERVAANDDERIYRAALLLGVGLADQATNELNAIAGRTELKEGLLEMIAGVQGRKYAGPAFLESPTAWLGRSYYQQSTNDLAGALASARKAAEKNFAFAWARVAELEFSFGRKAEAEKALQRALQLSPRNAQAVALRGFLLAADNRIEEAIKAFDEAILLDGALANAWLGRGLCLIRMGRIEEGKLDLQTAAAQESNRSLLRSYLGKAYSNFGPSDKGEKELELAKSLDPNDPTSWLYLALHGQQRNRINEAIRNLERSQELNENRSIYRSGLRLDEDRAVRSANLANIYHDAGMTEVSTREAIRAVNSDYANYSAHLFLANSYDRLRDPNQVNLRFETAFVTEYLLANLLSPVGAGTLSRTISQQEYSKLFEQDRLGLSSTTEYLSRGAWTEAGSQYGNYRNTAYAFDAYYRAESGNGTHSELEQRTLALQVKQQLTPKDSVFVQAIQDRVEAEDIAPYYDRSSVDRTLQINDQQEPLFLAGYHREWRPEIHTLLLFSRLDDTLRVRDEQFGFPVLNTNDVSILLRPGLGSITRRSGPLDYRSELEIYSTEVQQLLAFENFTTIAGSRFQFGDFQATSFQAVALPFTATNVVLRDIETDFQRINNYIYQHVQVTEGLRLIAGVSYDVLCYPANFRFAPLSEEEKTRYRLSPKGGVIWTPWKDGVVRAAYSQSLGGVSFDQSFQLEPSQVAGFNQAFRSVIPEALTGSTTAETFETYGISLEQRLRRDTYLAVGVEALNSTVDRLAGAISYDQTVFPTPLVFPTEVTERLQYKEHSLVATLDQLLGEYFVVGLRYRVSVATLNSEFISLPRFNRAGAAREPIPGWESEFESLTHQVTSQLLFNHPSGFFVKAQSIWHGQNNYGFEPDQPGDFFIHVNLYAGYRFPRRRAEITVGLLNVTDRDYTLHPLSLYTQLPRERTFYTRLRLNF